jgi:hypothetical protein
LVAEAWYFGDSFRRPIAELTAQTNLHDSELLIAIAGIALLVCFLLTHGMIRSLCNIFRNRRADVVFSYGLGLIYVNFPNVFRKIFNSETQGRSGLFSLSGPYDQNLSPAIPVASPKVQAV